MRSQLVEMLASLWERRYVSAESGVHFEGKTLWASWSRTVEYDDSERTTYYILRLDEGQLEGLRSRISAYLGDSVSEEEMEREIRAVLLDSFKMLCSEKDRLSAAWGVIAFLIVLFIGYMITR